MASFQLLHQSNHTNLLTVTTVDAFVLPSNFLFIYRCVHILVFLHNIMLLDLGSQPWWPARRESKYLDLTFPLPLIFCWGWEDMEACCCGTHRSASWHRAQGGWTWKSKRRIFSRERLGRDENPTCRCCVSSHRWCGSYSQFLLLGRVLS